MELEVTEWDNITPKPSQYVQSSVKVIFPMTQRKIHN